MAGFSALEVRAVANMGAYLSTNGPISSTNAAGSAMGGVYDIPSIFVEVRGAFTNTPPIDAYRGAGKPEANYLIERLVNLASVRTGIDAVKLRRRNIISRFPHRTAMGMKIDGGRFGANLDDAIALADLDGFRKRRRQSKKAGLLRGIGHCLLPRNRPAARQTSSPGPRSRRTARCRWRSVRSPTARGMKPPIRRSRPTCWDCRLTAFRFHQGDTDLLPGGQRPWRRAFDAYGRHRAGDGG